MTYFLSEASGNTFLLVDCLGEDQLDAQKVEEIHKKLLQEDRDDALILTGGQWVQGDLYLRMAVLGQDGEWGEFCGNGARACATHLFHKFPKMDRAFLSSSWGNLLLQQDNKRGSVDLPLPRLDINPKFIKVSDVSALNSALAELFPHIPFGALKYVEAIEPHLVIQAEWSEAALMSLGQALNQQRSLFPLGMNVNVWNPLEKQKIRVLTYERGVQRLTRSCGTGSVACATVYGLGQALRVETLGGGVGD